MLDILKKAFTWLIDFTQIKFIVSSIITALTLALYSLVQDLITPHINVQNLNTAFTSLPPSVWYFMDAFNVINGFTLIIGAVVIRFIIRRIPFIG